MLRDTIMVFRNPFFYYAVLSYICIVVKVNAEEFLHPATVSDILFVIRNDQYGTEVEKGIQLKEDLFRQAKQFKKHVTVKMLHEDWAPALGGWTVFSLFKSLESNIKDKKWIMFCETSTKIDLEGLVRVLSQYNYKKELYLGHALFDETPAIIHHFRFFSNPKSFAYADFDAGWAISKPLLLETVERLKEEKLDPFSIDVKHEVAFFLYNNGNGTMLTNVPQFCINKTLSNKECVTTVMREVPQCGKVDAGNILVSVKTCKKFHSTRVPVVKNTIGLHAKHMVYYSDKVDSSIPTEYAGVNNTERGHCQKLYNILKQTLQRKWDGIEWFVVIDDDTIVNFERLQQMLACYDANDPVVIGERYGYMVNQEGYGYNYPTGGSGFAMSRLAIDRILDSGLGCRNDNDPDDMWLGMVIKSLHPQVVLTHTNSLHQAQPATYSREFLSHRYLVSFHKHTNVDPIHVYKTYLKDQRSTKDEL